MRTLLKFVFILLVTSVMLPASNAFADGTKPNAITSTTSTTPKHVKKKPKDNSATSIAPKHKSKTKTDVAKNPKGQVDKTLKGPNGEEVITGSRGGKYYLSKSGKKHYMKKQP